MVDSTFIVIVTFNGMPWIEKCLKSIPTVYKIVVIDNYSSDDTVVYVKTKHPRVKLLIQSENLGFGAANNIGLSYALNQGADYVFLLNQDVYLEANTIDKLIGVHKGNPQFGILSPVHLSGSGNALDFNFSDYIKTNNSLLFDGLKNKGLKTVYEIPFVNAAAWLLPRNTLLKIGGFDPIFFHYGEDDNYCQRLLFHQLKIGVVPDTYIFHDREFRENETVTTNAEKLYSKEKRIKYKWANINNQVEEEINSYKQRLQRIIFKLKIKLKFKNMNIYKSELSLINSILPQILKSRMINKTIGAHYLKLDEE